MHETERSDLFPSARLNDWGCSNGLSEFHFVTNSSFKLFDLFNPSTEKKSASLFSKLNRFVRIFDSWL